MIANTRSISKTMENVIKLDADVMLTQKSLSLAKLHSLQGGTPARVMFGHRRSASIASRIASTIGFQSIHPSRHEQHLNNKGPYLQKLVNSLFVSLSEFANNYYKQSLVLQDIGELLDLRAYFLEWENGVEDEKKAIRLIEQCTRMGYQSSESEALQDRLTHLVLEIVGEIRVQAGLINVDADIIFQTISKQIHDLRKRKVDLETAREQARRKQDLVIGNWEVHNDIKRRQEQKVDDILIKMDKQKKDIANLKRWVWMNEIGWMLISIQQKQYNDKKRNYGRELQILNDIQYVIDDLQGTIKKTFELDSKINEEIGEIEKFVSTSAAVEGLANKLRLKTDSMRERLTAIRKRCLEVKDVLKNGPDDENIFKLKPDLDVLHHDLRELRTLCNKF